MVSGKPFLNKCQVNPTFRCKFVDDRLVAAIRSPAVPENGQTDTEDENDCFLATPQTRREAKQALLAKCRGEQEKQVDRLV